MKLNYNKKTKSTRLRSHGSGTSLAGGLIFGSSAVVEIMYKMAKQCSVRSQRPSYHPNIGHQSLHEPLPTCIGIGIQSSRNWEQLIKHSLYDDLL
jgi:hypothetical protein